MVNLSSFGISDINISGFFNGNREDDYKIMINIAGQEDLGPIIAYLPETVSMSSSSEWDTVAQAVLGETGSKLVDLAVNVAKAGATMSGYNINPVYQSLNAWKGNTPLEWSFNLQFNAVNDPATDVILPITRLLAMTMPLDMGNGLVQAPGPSSLNLFKDQVKLNSANNGKLDNWIAGKIDTVKGLYNKWVPDGLKSALNDVMSKGGAGSESCQIKVGNFMILNNVVVTNVNPKFDTQMHDGIPISAEADVDFKLMYAPTRAYLDTLFSTRTNRSNTNGNNS